MCFYILTTNGSSSCIIRKRVVNMINKELNNLFLLSLSYIENNDYKTANDLALLLYDIDSSIIENSEFTKDRIDDVAIKLLLHSIEIKPEVKNMSAFQYVCFGINDGISKIIDLSEKFKNTFNAGILNNLGIAYFHSGNLEKAIEIQDIVIRIAEDDLLSYDNQKDIIYYNNLIYQMTLYRCFNKKHEKKILDVLESDYVFDLETALLVSIIYDDYDYFCSHYDLFSSKLVFDDKINAVFSKYHESMVCPDFSEIKKFLNPIAIYDDLLYNN